MRQPKVFRISTTHFAELVGVSRQTVAEWALSWLGPAKVGRGQLIARQAVALWLQNVAAPPTPEGEESEGDARRRYEIARANREELRVKKEEQSLVSKDEAIGWLYQILSEAKTAFLSLPRRMAPELYGKDHREIEARIDEETKRILRKLARPIEDSDKEKATNGRSAKRTAAGTQPAGRPKRQSVGRKASNSGGENKRRARAVAE